MKTIRFATLFLFAFAIVISSCEKAEDAIDGTVGFETLADDDLVAEFNNEIFNDADAGISHNFKSKKGVGETFQTCAIISKTETATGKIIVIDYGQEGCEGKNGRVKKGKVIIEVQGTWQQHTRTVTLEDFFINDHKVEGTRITTSVRQNETITRTVKVEDGKVIFSDGTICLHEANKMRKLVEGGDTPTDRTDDVWETSGSASGTNFKGNEYTMAITPEKPVRNKTGCWFAVSGEKNYVVDTKACTIDFGNGECDNKATATVNGITKEIELGKRWKN